MPALAASALEALLAEALSFAFDDPAAVLLLRGVAEIGQLADVALSLRGDSPGRPGPSASASGPASARRPAPTAPAPCGRCPPPPPVDDGDPEGRCRSA
jgi:hypothetical protein